MTYGMLELSPLLTLRMQIYQQCIQQALFFSLYPRHTKYAMGVYSVCLFCVSVSLSVCQSVNIYFVSKISQELLYLEILYT